MRLDTFYQDMKDAMDYLGVKWGDMHLIEVTLCGNSLCYTYNGRSASVEIPR